jgi:hypothetical protein
VVGDARTQDFEVETGQVALAHTIFPRVGFSVSSGGCTIVQSRSLSAKTRSIADASATVRAKKQAAQQICRRHDGVLEQKCYRLDHNATDSNMRQGVQRTGASL